MKPSFIITCEHAGNKIPDGYEHLFKDSDDILMSHRGWDPGAYHIAEYLSQRLQCNLHSCSFTRLLIEANRSLHHDQLFSEYSRNLSDIVKTALIEEIYTPYRRAVEDQIAVSPKPVVHLSIHSFTPIWHGVTRMVDIGLLFDPSRFSEVNFCSAYKANLENLLPGMLIKNNEPYQGIDDGFATYLRTRYGAEEYAGIELEINQKYVGTEELGKIQAALVDALPYTSISDLKSGRQTDHVRP